MDIDAEEENGSVHGLEGGNPDSESGVVGGVTDLTDSELEVEAGTEDSVEPVDTQMSAPIFQMDTLNSKLENGELKRTHHFLHGFFRFDLRWVKKNGRAYFR